MIRQTLTLYSNRFIADYFNYNKDNLNVSKKFSFIRRFNVVNNIATDTDIYIIDNSIIDKVHEDLINTSETLEIVFPVNTTSVNVLYSSAFNQFDNSRNVNLKKSLYKLYNYNSDTNSLTEASIKCDKIRIYHPDDTLLLNAIIHVTAVYNDIRFHFFCNKVSNLESKIAEKEICLHNRSYSEYIELYIPNIESLFKHNNQYRYNTDGTNNLVTTRDSNNVYYVENINIISDKANFDSINLTDEYLSVQTGKEIITNVSVPVDTFIVDNQYMVPFNTTLLPFYIDNTTIDGDEYFSKRFTTMFKTIDNNYITSPINVSIIYIDNEPSNKYYNILIGTLPTTITFSEAYRFTINAALGFNDGICSIITHIDYPNKADFMSKYSSATSALQDAYKIYNNINRNDYYIKRYVVYNNDADFYNALIAGKHIYREEQVSENALVYIEVKYKQIKNKLNRTEFWAVDEDGDMQYLISQYNYYNYFYKSLTVEDEEIESYNNPISDEAIDSIGYILYIATDTKFKHIIYKQVAPLSFIDEAAFNLNGIFSTWSNLPDILIAKIVLVDKVIGRIISSNYVIITKEWYKYLVNNTDNMFRLKLNELSISDENSIIHVKENNISENMDLTYINFIDKINCVIRKTDTASTQSSSPSGVTNIVYKPIFYRVNELQTIRLHNSITQNIGINLGEYMTKVEKFKLIINNQTYNEIGRNDVFVIFAINAVSLSDNSGKYIIANQDDEYISDGNWLLY